MARAQRSPSRAVPLQDERCRLRLEMVRLAPVGRMLALRPRREGCGTEFCYHCQHPWHPDGPCAPMPPAPSLANPAAQLAHPEDAAHAEAEDIKVCPRCSAFIMKINDGSCNRMNCTVCGCLFCWLCLQEISDVHFLSPSLPGPSLLPAPPPSASEGTSSLERWGLGRVLGQSRRSSLSGCQQCLSVTSSVLLSLFVSPIITAVTVVNELWSVLPSPRGGEDGARDTTASLPSSSYSPRRGAVWKGQDSQSASTVALAGSMLSEGQDTSYREGINIEVEVSIEAVPHPAREQSLCSAPSGQSLSGDSLGGTSDRCSVLGVPAE
ncbi:E3 ubiquitin-protein ligase RNF19B-like [Egretta garzetta]|uniref:E3 ubiquitin-protein ligase RNF19B-like n=1 Tax=Egretta garzetta TaxID=188379 RepID=UPI00163B888B|nr:E3 ubiquitin-protein ligase RNF19B-like [Egretta garzetta]